MFNLNLFLSLINSYEKKWLLLLMLSTALLGILEVFAISAFMSIIIYAMQNNLPSNLLIETIMSITGGNNGIQNNIVIIAVFLILLYAFKNSLSLILEWATYRYSSSLERKIGRSLMHNYLNCSYQFKLSKKSTDFYFNIVEETYYFSMFYVASIIQLANAGLMCLAIMIWMLFQDVWLFSVMSVVIGLTLYLFNKYSKSLIQQKALQISEANSLRGEAILTPIHGFKETKMFGSQEYFLEKYYFNAKIIAKNNAFINVMLRSPRLILEFVIIVSVMSMMILFIKVGNVQSFFINISTFAFSLFRLLPSANTISSSISAMQRGKIALKILSQELQKTASIIAQENELKQDEKIERISFQKNIELKNISFSYLTEEPKWVIKDVSLTLEKNKTYAIIGHSGSGKTTLVDIICGLLKPAQGELSVDGKSVHPHPKSWWGHIGYIPQQIYLSNTNIRENIAFGLPPQKIDNEKIKKSIQMANLSEFVEGLEFGDATKIGENGFQLSGGQRQRVGIARALYHDPSVLILDEATASLDNVSEFEIMNAIRQLASQKTIIIIAHRLSTIERCDKIFVLDKSHLVDEGNFEYLAKHSPIVKKMLKPQKNDI